MDAFIEFLLGNIFFLFIAAAGIYSLFNRGRQRAEDDGSQNKPVSGQPKRTGSGKIDWESIFQQEKPEGRRSPEGERPTKPVPEAEGEFVRGESTIPLPVVLPSIMKKWSRLKSGDQRQKRTRLTIPLPFLTSLWITEEVTKYRNFFFQNVVFFSNA
ncbi:hypothetical protein [Sinobaca sp. H24]|uniref:hypothetical protein n=1 Tax=Sinobaca sp. H24 TaxID=2923376 RepID=UPI00207A14A5|nr:hypothetical protein [Sinobaca sp. H24]